MVALYNLVGHLHFIIIKRATVAINSQVTLIKIIKSQHKIITVISTYFGEIAGNGDFKCYVYCSELKLINVCRQL
jgi:hypothetical protein